nr:site-specific integrase [Ruficoccus amylovorans]
MAVRDGLILDNPARQIDRRKIAKPQIIIPTREQYRLLLQTMREDNPRAVRTAKGAFLVECLACSGMRVGEATAMRWGDIDFQRELFTVTGGQAGTKNGDVRVVPLFPGFKDFLKRLKKAVGGRPAASDLLIGIDSAKQALQSACAKAELPHFTHHSMRHYFVSNAIEAGIDFKTIAAWVGHKDGGLLVAKTYGHLRDTHSAEMAKLMKA